MASLNGDAPDGASAPFTCTWRSLGAGELATLSGELDIAYSPLLDQALRAAEADDNSVILLDLRELSFIDCSGARVIAKASERLREAGRRLILVRGPRRVDMVFSLTGAAETLEIVDLPHAEPAAQLLLRLALRPREAAREG